MEIRQLHTFRTVSRTLNFSRAAAMLNYAQSTVSAQIQALEEELGVPLFDRLGKHVTLTAAGQELLEYAEKILNLTDEAQAALSTRERLTGSLIINAPETLSAHRLPGVLRRFRECFPQVQLSLFFDFDIDLLRSIREGQVDLAFLLDEPLQAPDLIVETLIPEPLLLIAEPGHRLAHTPQVTFTDLVNEPFVLTEPACAYRKLFEQAACEAGVCLLSPMAFHSVEAVKQCVMAGLGLGFLTEIAVRTEIDQGRLVALDWVGRPFAAATQMIYHKDKWLSPAMRAFLQVTREVLGCEMVLVSG